jgi:hypothetical protein
MKKLLFIALIIGLVSCKKDKPILPNYSGLVVKESGSNYYAEILHKSLFKVGDTLTITYNEMPRHPHSYPSKRRNEFVKVVIIRF